MGLELGLSEGQAGSGRGREVVDRSALLSACCPPVTCLLARRFIRLRPDKSPESATGPDEIVELFQKQTRRTTVVKGGKGGNGGGGGNSGHGGGGAGHGQRRPREESEEGEGAGEVGEVGEEEEASDKEDEGSSSGAEAEAKQQQAGGKQSKDENLFLVFMEDK